MRCRRRFRGRIRIRIRGRVPARDAADTPRHASLHECASASAGCRLTRCRDAGEGVDPLRPGRRCLPLQAGCRIPMQARPEGCGNARRRMRAHPQSHAARSTLACRCAQGRRPRNASGEGAARARGAAQFCAIGLVRCRKRASPDMFPTASVHAHRAAGGASTTRRMAARRRARANACNAENTLFRALLRTRGALRLRGGMRRDDVTPMHPAEAACEPSRQGCEKTSRRC